MRVGGLVLLIVLGTATVQGQESSDLQTETETVTRQRTKTLPDGTQEVETRSGRVRPAREGGPRVGQIYDEDVKRVVKRVEPLYLTSFGIGPVVAGNLGNDGVFYGLQLGQHYEVNPWAEIRLSIATAIAGENKGTYSNLGIGASWFSTDEDISPMFGGEFGLALATGEGRDAAGGFHAGLRAGVRFFRTARAQMELGFFAQTLFVKENKPVVGGAMINALF